MFADVSFHKLGKFFGLTGFRVFAGLRESFGGLSVQFVGLAYETFLFLIPCGHLEKPVISPSVGEVISKKSAITLELCKKVSKSLKLSPFSSPPGENAHAATRLTPFAALA